MRSLGLCLLGFALFFTAAPNAVYPESRFVPPFGELLRKTDVIVTGKLKNGSLSSDLSAFSVERVLRGSLKPGDSIEFSPWREPEDTTVLLFLSYDNQHHLTLYPGTEAYKLTGEQDPKIQVVDTFLRLEGITDELERFRETCRVLLKEENIQPEDFFAGSQDAALESLTGHPLNAEILEDPNSRSCVATFFNERKRTNLNNFAADAIAKLLYKNSPEKFFSRLENILEGQNEETIYAVFSDVMNNPPWSDNLDGKLAAFLHGIKDVQNPILLELIVGDLPLESKEPRVDQEKLEVASELLRLLTQRTELQLRFNIVGKLSEFSESEEAKKRIIPVLLEMRNDPELNISEESMRALGPLKAESAIAPLARIMEVEALRHFDIIREGPNDHDASVIPFIIEDAVGALREIGTPEVVPPLIRLLRIYMETRGQHVVMPHYDEPYYKATLALEEITGIKVSAPLRELEWKKHLREDLGPALDACERWWQSHHQSVD